MSDTSSSLILPGPGGQGESLVDRRSMGLGLLGMAALGAGSLALAPEADAATSGRVVLGARRWSTQVVSIPFSTTYAQITIRGGAANISYGKTSDAIMMYARLIDNRYVKGALFLDWRVVALTTGGARRVLFDSLGTGQSFRAENKSISVSEGFYRSHPYVYKIRVDSRARTAHAISPWVASPWVTT